MRYVLMLLLLTACADPLAPRASLSTHAAEPVPGQLPALVPCWAERETAPLTGFLWCGEVR